MQWSLVQTAHLAQYPFRRDSDLTERITGLEVRLARRSAEVQMLKAAVAAVQAHARPPSPPAAPEVGKHTGR